MDALTTRTGLQHLSHESLLTIAEPSARPDTRLDAIIVPAARPAKYLATAIARARETNCELVVLCSRETHPGEVRSLFASRDFDKGTTVRVPETYNHSLLKFRTSGWARSEEGRAVCRHRDSDLSTKRNIGLLIARMLGWQRIFFMDDDIRGITREDISRTVSLLDLEGGWYGSAGIRVKDFPDNSVVCHARRKMGQPQDVFVSGSVLAVDCIRDLAFFPDIYNEDWLFFYEDVAEHRMASPDLHVTKMQMAYKPFAHPDRAAHQEFGDLIAEGLYSLLHEGCGYKFATSNYWQQFKEHRMNILEKLRTHASLVNTQTWNQVEKSLAAAQETLTSIRPGTCHAYIQAWQEDLGSWRKRLNEIQPAQTTEDALLQLDLHP